MRPAVDRNSGNVARRIEAARAQHAAQLVTHLALERLEWGSQQFLPPFAKLIYADPPNDAKPNTQPTM